jgi:hypothetical protein
LQYFDSVGSFFGLTPLEWADFNEKLNKYLVLFTNIITVIKSRRMRRAGNVFHVGEMKNTYKICGQKT